MASPRPVRVFISYSHDSEEHAARVLKLANRLRADGIEAWIDQYEAAPARGWPRWMERQVEEADFVLCVCTETYRRRFDQREEIGKGLGVTWEGALVRIGLYLDQGENRKFLAVLLEDDYEQHIPTPIRAFTHYSLSDPKGYERLYRHLTDQPEAVALPLGPQRVLDSKPQRSLLGEAVGRDNEPESEDLLAEYGEWARDRYSHLDLIGIDAGDVQVKLEEVYVPLRMVHRRERDVDGLGLFRGGQDLIGGGSDYEPVEIETLLSDRETWHALLFGEPGSGKTTALMKLHQLCWDRDDETIPVLLRLRHFDKELLDIGLAAFIEYEIRQLSSGRLEGVGERLWTHGRLLLLFDGLDEIADATYREEVLRRIGWYLGQDDAMWMRAVVSCRRVGLPGREADRERKFQPFEVRPFQDEQIAQLVTQWFREVARRGKIDSATADKRVNTLISALKDREKANQQILEMASNPLLLTLLCVVVLLGNDIPRKRVRFYEQCLDVLLDRWPRQRGRPAPVELSTARDALAHLAFTLHAARRRDDLSWAEAVVELMTPLGGRNEAREVFNWAHSTVGLLVDYTEEHYGFVHLGLQEHLAARHLIANPAALEIFSNDFDESWWREVFFQVSALSERVGFDALMARLLEHTDALERRSGLLRDCLGETSAPELAAFVRVLTEGNEARQLAVLRLLGGFQFRPEKLTAALADLGSKSKPEVKDAALRLLRDADNASSRQTEESFALLIESSQDEKPAKRLADLLENLHGGRPAAILIDGKPSTGMRLEQFGTVLVLLGSEDSARTDAGLLRKIYDDKRWLVVRLPGEQQGEIPTAFIDCEQFSCVLDEEDALIESVLGHLAQEMRRAEPKVEAEVISRQQSYTEPVTGTVFLPVPGGRFVMGHEDLFSVSERKAFLDDELGWVLNAPTPACTVRLSPYWLAKTPVTNQQYGKFLQATSYEEPSTWRDRRFSDSQQPVVNVSWDDAVAYCRWLSEGHPEGYIFQLPSEAQWEFAARGSESWMYPWGHQPPDSTLACYELDYQEDRPAAVGSYPAGAGLFGHLDLAGLVWEWCRDAWEPDHSRWSKGEPLDPIGESDSGMRPLRGGAWDGGAGDLRSAIRGVGEPRNRDYFFGFRLLCAPPSSNP